MASRDYHKDSPVSLRLPAALLQWIDAQAAAEGRSRTAVIVEAVEAKRDHAATS